jgi:transposase
MAAGDGKPEAAIAAEMKVNRKTVRLWCERFVARGLPGLWEVAPGRGRKATYSAEKIQAVIDATLQSKPKG